MKRWTLISIIIWSMVLILALFLSFHLVQESNDTEKACEDLGGVNDWGTSKCYKEDENGILQKYNLKQFNKRWRLIKP